jgi:hypothetical protein
MIPNRTRKTQNDPNILQKNYTENDLIDTLQLTGKAP